jgi:hypothetical protein
MRLTPEHYAKQAIIAVDAHQQEFTLTASIRFYRLVLDHCQAKLDAIAAEIINLQPNEETKDV